MKCIERERHRGEDKDGRDKAVEMCALDWCNDHNDQQTVQKQLTFKIVSVTPGKVSLDIDCFMCN